MFNKSLQFFYSVLTIILISHETVLQGWSQDLEPSQTAVTSATQNEERKTGLIENKPDSFQGYTLLTPMMSSTTWLIDNNGKIVHKWVMEGQGLSSYLLPNGNLLRTVTSGMFVGGGRTGGGSRMGGGGSTGRVQEYTWDGELVWDFKYAGDHYLLHHGVERMPNGNTLMIAWERKTADEAIQAGRSPDVQGDEDLMVDYIIEVKPTGKTTGEIVWEWHVWDHLVQDYDPDLKNYGVVTEHPELIHLNPIDWLDEVPQEDINKLQSLGYLGGGGAPGNPDDPNNPTPPFNMKEDWNHTNSISYNAEHDQIALSVLGFSEIWVIDHSTTTEEAASHSGGKSGKGGGLLYRWGNPMAYGAGTKEDRQLYTQHDIQWIPKGLKGEGNLLMFNNGRDRADGNYSSIVEIVPSGDVNGKYELAANGRYGPDKPAWVYTDKEKTNLYSPFLSGTQRLPNGNTLVISGMGGTLTEVTEEGETVWKYIISNAGGPFGPGGFPPMEEMLDKDKDGKITLIEAASMPFMNEESVKQLDKDGDGILSKEELPKGPPGMPGPGGFGPGGPPDFFGMMDQDKNGEVSLKEASVMPFFTEDFFKQLDKNGDGILKKDEMPEGPPPGMPGPGGFGPGGRRGRGGPGGPGGGMPPGPGFGPGGRGGPGGMPGFGGGTFTARRYAPDYAGLSGKTLTPGKTIEEDKKQS